MINYNPKIWFRHIFYFHKSDTMVILWQEMIIIGIYTGLLTWFLEHYHGDHLSQFKNTIGVHSLVGVVMGLFLVFRTNTAYDRWWEGRKQWGALVNASRNLSMKIHTILPVSSKNKKDLLALITTFPFAAKDHLRGIKNSKEIIIPEHIQELINNKEHVPLAITTAIYQKLKYSFNEKEFSGEELIILDNEISELMDIVGACERIRSTPIPFSYSLFMKKFIFVYTITLPFGIIPDFRYWSIPVTIFIFYVMVSLEVLAEEIEDPFGIDDNDLPLDEIAGKIRSNIIEILK